MLKIKYDDLETPTDSIYDAPLAGSSSQTEEEEQSQQQQEDDPSLIADLAMAPLRGVAGAAEEILEVGNIIPGIEYNLGDNWLGESKTTAGGVVEGIVNFGVGFIGAIGAVGKLGKLSKAGKLGSTAKKAEGALKAGGRTRQLAKYTAAGAIADFAVFDAHEARLSDLIQRYPSLENPVSEYLASDMSDSELEGRLKNAAEGTIIGGVFDILTASLRYIRKSRELRAEGKTAEEVAEGTAKEAEQLEFAFAKHQKEKGTTTTTEVTPPAKEADKADSSAKLDEEVPAPPKQPKSTEILKVLVKGGAKGEKSAVHKLVDDLENADPEEALKNLEDKFGEDGVLININAFTDGDEVSREAVALMTGLYDGILKTKKDFLLDEASRGRIRDELKDFGFDEASDLFQGLSKQHEFDAKLVAAHITLRNHTKQMTENLLEFATLRKQLAEAKRTGQRAAEVELADKLNVAELKFLQHQSQVSVLATAIGAVRSQRGRDLVNLKYLDASRFENSKDVADALDNLSAVKDDMTPEQRAAAMEKAAAVVEKHGPGGLAKLGAGKGLIDLHNELWINALLSGPRTTAINMIGNALTAVYLPLEKALGAQVGYWRTSDPRYLTARNELMKMSFFFDSFREAFELGTRAFKQEESLIQRRAAVTSELQGPALTADNLKSQGGVLEKIANHFGTKVDSTGRFFRIPTRLLTGTDEFFKQIQFRYMAKAEAAVKAHDELLKKYKNEPIPAEELATKTADLLEGVMREGGERYSSEAVRRDAYEALQKAMAENPEEKFDSLTQQAFMRDYYNKNFDKTKGAISDSAFRSAQEATFTLPQEGGFGKWMQDGVAKMPALRLVMPFVSTPVNILKFFGQRTAAFDLPVSRSLHKRYMAELNSDDPLVKAAANGRMAAGVGLWTTAAGLAWSGKLTGHGPEREAERKVLQQTGWQPYSIKVGDKYISYQRLDPFATFLGMTADMAEFVQKAENADTNVVEDIVPSILMGLSQNVVNKSYMTGIQQVLEAATQPQRKLDTFLRTRAGSYIPAVFGQAVGTVDGDEAIREARGVLEAIQKRIPVFAGGLDPRRNVLGEKIERTGTGIGLVDYVSPIILSSKKNDPISEEMAKAQHAFSMPSRKIQGGIDLAEYTNDKGQSAYDRMLELQSTVKIGGKTLRQRLMKLIQDKKFKQLSDEPEADLVSPRAKMIKRVVSKYRAYAKYKMLKEFPELSQETALVDQINFNRARGRDVEGLLEQLKGLR